VDTLPQASIANKMRLGWIDPSWIETFDFGKNPTGHAVTLHAAEALARTGPPAGRKAAIEVRIADGWNYYFEYRRTLGGAMTDQQLATTAGGAQVVLGTDVRADGAAKPARPVILRLAVDADGNGPLLKAIGEDYEETDVTNPQRQHDFRLVFDQIDPADGNAAHVHVEYIAAHRPELQITPAPGRGDWKSPDIDLVGPGGITRSSRAAGIRSLRGCIMPDPWRPRTFAWASHGCRLQRAREIGACFQIHRSRIFPVLAP
jgi:hypothetical protein